MFTKPSRSILPLLFVYILTLAVQPVQATICGKATVCELFNYADIIFVGKAVEKTEKQDGHFKKESTLFEVSESIVGSNVPKRLLETASGFSNDTGFQIGESYLIFGAGNEREGFMTRQCFGNLHLSVAKKEIEELRSLKNTKDSLLFGTVYEQFDSPGTYEVRKPFPGLKLNIHELNRDKTSTITSDSDGKYNVRVQPGEFRITPVVPSLIKWHTYEEEAAEVIKLKPGGCASGYFIFNNAATVSGRVVDAAGKPVENVRVQLIPTADKSSKSGQSLASDSKANGDFSFGDVGVGQYFLAINYTQAPSPTSPYPLIVYPAKTNLADGRIIGVGRGISSVGHVIQLPQKLESAFVEGKIFLPNGEPAVDAGLYFEEELFPGMGTGCSWISTSKEIAPGVMSGSVSGFGPNCNRKVNSNGEFRLGGFIGRRYRVSGSLYVGKGESQVVYEVKSDYFEMKAENEPLILTMIQKPK